MPVRLLLGIDRNLRGKCVDYDLAHFSDIGNSLRSFSRIRTPGDRPVVISRTRFQLLSDQFFDRNRDRGTPN